MMPYKVKKVNEDFIVVNSETGKPVPGGNHGNDEDKAKRHLRALYANVKEAKSMAEYDVALTIKGGPGSGRHSRAGEIKIGDDIVKVPKYGTKEYKQFIKELSDATRAGKVRFGQPAKKSFSDLKSAITERVEELSVKGGSGSGNFGHTGRLGERGGSGDGGGSANTDKEKEETTSEQFPDKHQALLDKGYTYQGWRVKGSGVIAEMIHTYKGSDGSKKQITVTDYGEARGQALVRSHAMMNKIREDFPEF